MTLRQLQYALAVAEARSFTRAAQQLHVSQPSLSQQIASLEAEIGGPLFERPPKPVMPTAAGRAFLAEARVAMTSAHRAFDAARRTMALAPETIEIATVRSLAVSMLPGCLTRWHDAFPGVAIKLQEHPHREAVVDAVVTRRAELGIGPAPVDWDGALEWLGWDQLVVILPPDDPFLQTPGAVPLAEMRDYEWVLFDKGHGLSENIVKACAEAGFEPRPVLRTAQVEAAVRLAASGLGAALIPLKNVPEDLRSHMRLTEPPVVWKLAVFARGRGFGRLARQFVQVVSQADWQWQMPQGAWVLQTASGTGGG